MEELPGCPGSNQLIAMNLPHVLPFKSAGSTPDQYLGQVDTFLHSAGPQGKRSPCTCQIDGPEDS